MIDHNSNINTQSSSFNNKNENIKNSKTDDANQLIQKNEKAFTTKSLEINTNFTDNSNEENQVNFIFIYRMKNY